MNPQSGSLQPAMLDGIAGGLETTPLTVLLAPVLVTTPKPVEFVMVPVLVPTNAPTVLLSPVLVTGPDAVESAMVPPSDQAADDAANAGAGDRTRSGRNRDGAGADPGEAACDALRADGDVAARLRAGDGAADRIESD